MIQIIIIAAILKFSVGLPLEDTKFFSKYFDPHIVGGVKAPEHYAPYMVALLVGEQLVSLNCGGSLMTPRLVLTAAHCIEIFVYDGELLPSFHGLVGSNDWSRGGKKVEFSGFDIHPDYDYQHIKNDVGFLMLTTRVVLNQKIATIALDYDWIDQEECFVAGWGRIEKWGYLPYKLQLLYVNTISPEACAEGIRRAEEDWGWNVQLQHDVEICTFHSKGHGMCNGDSGSALVKVGSGRQIGIASWAFACARGYPDVFARISGFRNYTETFINLYV